MRHHFIWTFIISAGILCGCASTRENSAMSLVGDSQKIALRNNAASLLHDLLEEEKNVSKVLIIKRNSEELSRLIKAISTVSRDASKQLEELSKTDPTFDLKGLNLPAGEMAARKAIAKTKEHELLTSSGENFQFQLLLTQADALSYGWHLSEIAAENSSSSEAVRIFKEASMNYERLYVQVISMLKMGVPGVK